MTNNKFGEYSITDLLNAIFSGIGLIISAVTLFIAYQIFKNFDAKKTHINKQLETVLNLVEDINKTIISVSFESKIPQHILEQMGTPGKSLVEKWPYSLFIISTIDNSKEKYESVFLNKEVLKALPFLNYMNNPLLPNPIAKRLHAFYSPRISYCPFFKAPDTFVVICSNDKDDIFEYPNNVPAFKNWDGFIQCSKDLKNEIQQWLKRYGAEDINFNHTIQLPAEGLHGN